VKRMIRDKKIVFSIPTLAGGGMERAVLNFSKPLAEMGYDVTVFLLAGERNSVYDIPEKVRIISGVKNNYNKIKFAYSLICLRNYCVKNKVDYVFSFSGYHSCYVIISLLNTNTNVYAFHRANPYLKYGVINDLLNRLFFPLCSGLVVQTELAKSIFRKKYNHKNIIVVPNPVKETQLPNPIKKEKVIITVSRLIKSKGVDKLIEIYNKVANSIDDWELWIVGEGPEKQKLAEMINLSHHKNKIKLLGFRKDIDELLSTASIFAFTSESEGYPNALLEAMCSGLACISYDCIAGPSEIINNGKNGFLIENGNKDKFISKLEILMLDENLRHRFSNEAIKLNKKHNPSQIVEKFIREIHSLN
jgi:GalNAc-alpha-(1->4)-GalNAc-alpha-(1->3)-diNAcBac-PP-undecaprenol alpha-1,4-N-acetyl-D-galactosaminyltransferase